MSEVATAHPKAIDSSVAGAPGSLEAPGFLKRIPSIIDLSNPKDEKVYDYRAKFNMSFPVDMMEAWEARPHPVAVERPNPLTGDLVRFPYDHQAAWEPEIPIEDMMEVVDADTPRGPIDVFLDGFVIAELPKSPGQIYKLKGTAIGDVGINDNVWAYPVVAFEEGSAQEYIDVTVDMLEVIDRESDMAELESTNILHQSYHKNQNPFFATLAEKLPITEEECYKIKDEVMENASLWNQIQIGGESQLLIGEGQASNVIRHYKDSKQIALDQIPQAMNARLFWRRWGTRSTDGLPDEQFDEMWVHFFCNPALDRYELRRGCNIYNIFDVVPEPTVLKAIMFACRRLNEYALTIRMLEAVRYKTPKDQAVYNWVIQEIQPTLDELGIVGPEALNLHLRPEKNTPHPF